MAAAFLATHGIDLQAELTAVQFGLPALPSSTADPHPTTTTASLPPLHPLTSLPSIHLPSAPPTITTHTLTLTPPSPLITSLHPSPTPHPSTPPRIALPSLCHPHIHLDKAYLYSSHLFSSLPPPTTFASALSSTSRAKTLFHPSDLLTRGTWLLAESSASGVTHLRAFVEADATVGLACVRAGIALRAQWRARCAVQLCVFAQEPVFSGADGDENRALVEEAAGVAEVEALGSTPYVEADPARARRNVAWAVELAVRLRKHLDFHLDYSLDEAAEPLVWHVLRTLRAEEWARHNPGRTVCLGHCTRLTLFSGAEWARLVAEVADLPVYFIGLPTSDLFMMGRGAASTCPSPSPSPSPSTSTSSPLSTTTADKTEHQHSEWYDPPRGTLPVPWMIRSLGLRAALGVNNVGNAFTPWGSADPLGVAALGVGVYQVGSEEEMELLYECVSGRAREAIGFVGEEGAGIGDRGRVMEGGEEGVRAREGKGEVGGRGVLLREGDRADLVVYGGGRPGERGRSTVREVVCDGGRERVVVFGGWRVG
ncbi:hypothetical protein MMC34_004947 [Xylographa carneopallida]|nr:hypothetical protein [Xylographa carneopallida]